MPVPTIAWSKAGVKLIDQRLLPRRFKYIYCEDVEQLWQAIRTLAVRGAPAIGIAAAFGVVLGTRKTRAKDFTRFYKRLNKVCQYLNSSRPTAVNLNWALERIKAAARKNRDESVPRLKRLLLEEALRMLAEDEEICRRLAKFGSGLLKDKDRVLTHCNAGGLATSGYGTALGVFYMAKEEGKRLKVYAGETRPLLQGARLTTWELQKSGIDVTLLCDNMAADLMGKDKIDKVIVGADRIASNGDTANKIGTYSLAVLAKAHHIPFYVIAPVSSFDFKLKEGRGIPIEQRDKKEVTEWGGVKIAPRNTKVYNPAFDVTPHKLISAIVTENGILRPPYKRNLKKAQRHKGTE